MPKEVTMTVNLYTLVELKKFGTSHAYYKAIDTVTELATENWAQYVIEDWRVQLFERGYGDVAISFSGFWSQGDGASFTTESIDARTLIPNLPNPERFAPLVEMMDRELYDAGLSIRRIDTMYSHENTVKVIDEPSSDVCEALHGELYGAVKEDARDQMRQLYDDLKEDYENITSEDALSESANVNDMFFYEDGRVAQIPLGLIYGDG